LLGVPACFAPQQTYGVPNMALETASYINGLVATNPTATDTVAQADDHIRLIKAAIKATFPNVTGAITATQAEVNKLDGFTGTVTDLNYAKDLRATGVTSTEFDYLDGVTSNIQTQLNAKQATVTGAASTGVSSNFSTNRAMITDGSGKMSTSAVTATELGYLDGVTSNIQTQFNNVSGYPLDVRVFTSGSSYTVPAGAKAILIKASGGGGGGAHWIFSGNNAGSGLAGAQTTVTNSTLGISIAAKGGAAGIIGTGGYQDFITGDSGGDIQRGKGAMGGSAFSNNYDTAAFTGRPGNLVTKYVQNSSVGGQVISFSLGAGGAGSSYGRQGETGYVEITVW